jgi:hypothetical protein
MTGSLPLPGWYPDPSGAPRSRYFDGKDWTDQPSPQPPQRPAMPDDERAHWLDAALAHELNAGGRVESRTKTQAIVVYGRRINFARQAVIAIIACAIGFASLVLGVAFKATMIGSFPILSLFGFLLIMGGVIWAVISFTLMLTNKERRLVLHVDPHGNVTRR